MLKSFSQENKSRAIQHSLDNPSKSYAQIAKEFGVCRKSLSYWVNTGLPEGIKKWKRGWAKEKSGKAKFILIQFLGGRCSECGYHGCDAALDFHHRDPSQKHRPMAQLLTSSFDVAVEEAKKCILLCCRCHREKHDQESSLEPTKLHAV